MYLFRTNQRRQKKVYLKLIKDIIFVLSRQVFYPCVNVSDNLYLDFEEYHFLSDCV